MNQTGAVTFEDAGYNLWTAKTENNSGIILIMSSDTMGFVSMVVQENSTFVSLIATWYEQIRDTKKQYYGDRRVLYSEPYHEGEFFMHLKLKRSDTDAALRQQFR